MLLGPLLLVALLIAGCEEARGPSGGPVEERAEVHYSVVVDDKGRALATLSNRGDAAIGYGYPFELERQHGGTWTQVKVGCVWTLPMLTLDLHAKYEQRIYLCDRRGSPESLPAGTYRVTKDLEILDSGDRFDVRAEFEVSGG